MERKRKSEAREGKETLRQGSLRGKPLSRVMYYFVFRDLDFNYFCSVDDAADVTLIVREKYLKIYFYEIRFI